MARAYYMAGRRDYYFGEDIPDPDEPDSPF